MLDCLLGSTAGLNVEFGIALWTPEDRPQRM